MSDPLLGLTVSTAADDYIDLDQHAVDIIREALKPPPVVLEAGWGWPGAASRAHYFPEGDLTSLCKRWAYTGARTDPDSPGRYDAKQPSWANTDCAECTKRLAKILAARQES